MNEPRPGPAPEPGPRARAAALTLPPPPAGTFILTSLPPIQFCAWTACQVWEAQGFLVGGRWAVFMLFGND